MAMLPQASRTALYPSSGLPAGPGAWSNRVCPSPALESPDGALLIYDQFTDWQPEFQRQTIKPIAAELLHGIKVNQAANDQGFSGEVVRDDQTIALDPSLAQAIQAKTELFKQTLNRFEVQEHLDSLLQGQAVSILSTEAAAVQRARLSGAQHCALNMSQAVSIASLATDLIVEAKDGWSEDSQVLGEGQQLLSNLANAFDLDMTSLQSEDLSISVPERNKLAQALVDKTTSALTDPWVNAARSGFRNAVASFEANHNSVVISAGNEGEFRALLNGKGDGFDIELPANFEENLLNNEFVTSIGATDLQNGKVVIAAYSNPSTLYADGNVGESQGTSFAAPRVAAVMTELHRQHPDWTSAQVEQNLRQGLTHGLQTPAGQVQVLDEARAKQFLSEGQWILTA